MRVPRLNSAHRMRSGEQTQREKRSMLHRRRELRGQRGSRLVGATRAKKLTTERRGAGMRYKERSVGGMGGGNGGE